jgi:hypothetical protein
MNVNAENAAVADAMNSDAIPTINAAFFTELCPTLRSAATGLKPGRRLGRLVRRLFAGYA